MRLLLVTDTHGDLATINQRLQETGADACLHAGDFGLYDQLSVDRLSLRELRLRLKHSHLPKTIRKLAWKVSHDELKGLIREHGLLNSLQPYLDGKAHFVAPVYTVWGNHEDIEVVRMLRSGQRRVENLHLLDENHAAELPSGVRLLGLGGNVYYEGDELFAQDMTGSGGKVRASWLQFARLIAAERRRDPAKHTFMLSHVSPGKVRILERLALVLGLSAMVSGHMDPPISHAYSLFTICQPDEVMARSANELARLRDAWSQIDRSELSEEDIEAVEFSLRLLDLPPLPPDRRGTRPSPKSIHGRYFSTQFVNLADAPAGWGVIDIEDDRWRLSLHS